MNETDERLTRLEDELKDLRSLSGGLIKLLFLSLAYHTQHHSLTKEQAEVIRAKLLAFMDEPALEQVLYENDIAEEVADVVRMMAFSEEVP